MHGQAATRPPPAKPHRCRGRPSSGQHHRGAPGSTHRSPAGVCRSRRSASRRTACRGGGRGEGEGNVSDSVNMVDAKGWIRQGTTAPQHPLHWGNGRQLLSTARRRWLTTAQCCPPPAPRPPTPIPPHPSALPPPPHQPQWPLPPPPPGVDVVQRVDHDIQPLPEAVAEHILCSAGKKDMQPGEGNKGRRQHLEAGIAHAPLPAGRKPRWQIERIDDTKHIVSHR